MVDGPMRLPRGQIIDITISHQEQKERQACWEYRKMSSFMQNARKTRTSKRPAGAHGASREGLWGDVAWNMEE